MSKDVSGPETFGSEEVTKLADLRGDLCSEASRRKLGTLPPTVRRRWLDDILVINQKRLCRRSKIEGYLTILGFSSTEKKMKNEGIGSEPKSNARARGVV